VDGARAEQKANQAGETDKDTPYAEESGDCPNNPGAQRRTSQDFERLLPSCDAVLYFTDCGLTIRLKAAARRSTTSQCRHVVRGPNYGEHGDAFAHTVGVERIEPLESCYP